MSSVEVRETDPTQGISNGKIGTIPVRIIDALREASNPPSPTNSW
jgi:hypothetical protein